MRSIGTRSLVLMILCLVLVNCQSVTRSKNLQASDTADNFYEKPAFGLYFYGPNDQLAKAVKGEGNPFFDPAKPTLVFLPGWGLGKVKEGRRYSFNYAPYTGPDLDIAKLWRDKGWNFAFMDWIQFSDTAYDLNRIGVIPGNLTYDNAEHKIWAPDDDGQLIYHLADGSAHVHPARSVGELLADEYIDFMGDAYQGQSVRFVGHSLGTQLAIHVANLIYERANAAAKAGQPFNQNILPSRISVTDLTASNCAHNWLPTPEGVTRQRRLTATCPLDPVGSDWVGERLIDSVTAMKNQTKPVAFDAYRCWEVSSSGLGGDAVAPLNKLLAFSQLTPSVSRLDLNHKHSYCEWAYLWSIAFPEPQVEASKYSGKRIDSDCAKNYAEGLPHRSSGISAASSDDQVRASMNANMQFIQIAGRDTLDLGDNVYRCEER